MTMNIHPELAKAIVAAFHAGKRYAIGGAVTGNGTPMYDGNAPVASGSSAGMINAAPAAAMSATATPGQILPFSQSTFQATAPQSTLNFDPSQLQENNYGNAIQQSMGNAQAANGQATATGAQQGNLAQALQAQANGAGPSLAQSQLTTATQQNAAAAAGQAASMRGVNPALAARMAGQNQATAGQAAAGQSAQMRAQDQLNAQSALSQALQAQRSGDLSQAQNASSLLGSAGALQNTQNANNIQNLTDAQKLQLEQNQGNQQAIGSAQSLNQQTSTQNSNLAQGFSNNVYNWVAGGVNAAANVGGKIATGSKNSTPDDSPAGPEDASGSTIGDNTTVTPVDSGGSYNYTPPTFNAHGGLIQALMARRYADGGQVAPDLTLDSVRLNQSLPGSPITDPSASSATVAPAASANSGPATIANIDSKSGLPAAGTQAFDTATSMIPIIGPLIPLARKGIQSVQYNNNQAAEQAALASGHDANNPNDPMYYDRLRQTQTYGQPFDLWADNAIADTGSAIGGAANSVGDWFKKTFATGGSVGGHPSLGAALRAGGSVPGKAAVRGDSYSNDTVPAVLSPGEIVLPRSVTQSKDPAKHAAAFVAAIKKRGGADNAPKSYGELVARHRELQNRIEALEAKSKRSR